MTPNDLLTFWFGSTDLRATPPPEVRRRWFAGGPAFDAEIVERFASSCETDVESWPGDAGLLAGVIMLDQVPRNAWRGEARAFAFDPRARARALPALDAGRDAAFGPFQRLFLLLPLEHAEELALQDRSVAAFSALAETAPPEDPDGLRGLFAFAESHRAIIRRFGRFPGRNAALGRADTEAEAAYLASGGETFGQR